MHVSKFNQTLVDGRNYGSNREKDQILSTIRDASMKLDAMKAFRTIRGQLQQFRDQCEVTRKSLLTLDIESRLLHTEISKCKRKIQGLLNSKHNVVAERGDRLSKCYQISKQLEKVNAQLDILSEARGSRGRVRFQAVYTSNIIKAKESAKKKLQSGGKLSFGATYFTMKLDTKSIKYPSLITKAHLARVKIHIETQNNSSISCSIWWT